MWFFESYIGGYVLQSVLHSMTTLFLVEMSLRVWDVGDALERFRYRLLVILMPFFMFPVFQFLNPERGSFYFIEDEAVLSGIRWLGVRLFGGVFAWQIFIFAVIFELLYIISGSILAPILFHALLNIGEFTVKPFFIRKYSL